MSGSAVPAKADNQNVKPFDVSADAFQYHFTRSELACLVSGAHDPPPTPPNATKFHVGLLDVLEDTRIRYGDGLKVRLSHVCAGHNLAANVDQCIVASPEALGRHAEGHAVDVSPTAATPAKCRSLWNAAKATASALNNTCGEHAGEPSRADLPEGLAGVRISSRADIEAKLNAGTALTAKEASSFAIHFQVLKNHEVVLWECWLGKAISR